MLIAKALLLTTAEEKRIARELVVKDDMKSYNYVVIGGGMTADAAIRGIRQVDKAGTIAMFSREPHPPYNRPPLSKRLWLGKPEAFIWRGTEKLDISIHLDCTVENIDPAEKVLTTAAGEQYGYEKLLLATGGSVIRLPFGGEEIIYLRDLEDYRRLRKLADDNKHFAVIGGGFIGSEIANSLAKNEQNVTMVFPESAVCGNIFPEEIAAYLTGKFRDNGIEVHTKVLLKELERTGDKLSLSLDNGKALTVDAAVAGIGIRPNVKLARDAGLQVNKGIVVNKTLATSAADIYAAGDNAEFNDAVLNIPRVVAHEENANMGGYYAGMAMAGNPQEYTLSPYFYSKLFDINYEGIGIADAKLDTWIDWQTPFQEGVIYYLEDNRLRGIVLWNKPKKLKLARALLSSGEEFADKSALTGKIE